MSGYYLQTVPQSVKAAGQETLEETGFNPLQTDVTSIDVYKRQVMDGDAKELRLSGKRKENFKNGEENYLCAVNMGCICLLYTSRCV